LSDWAFPSPNHASLATDADDDNNGSIESTVEHKYKEEYSSCNNTMENVPCAQSSNHPSVKSRRKKKKKKKNNRYQGCQKDPLNTDIATTGGNPDNNNKCIPINNNKCIPTITRKSISNILTQNAHGIKHRKRDSNNKYIPIPRQNPTDPKTYEYEYTKIEFTTKQIEEKNIN
jgi:hypothetical protein